MFAVLVEVREEFRLQVPEGAALDMQPSLEEENNYQLVDEALYRGSSMRDKK
jgi:hypothetical protein